MRKNSIGKGIIIAVRDENKNLVTPDNLSGYLGSLDAGKYFLQVEFDRTERIRGDFFGLERQGPIYAILKKDYLAETASKIFRRTLEVYDGGKCPYVSYPDNHFKLLELYKNGVFKIWEIGITMRNRNFYLVAQDVWRERAYRDGKTVVLPAISNWVSLRKVMFMTDEERCELEKCRGKKKFVAIVSPDHENLLRLKELEHVSKYVARPEITADGLKKNQGRITWWNDCHGIGGIITAFGQAKIHRNNLVPPDEFISFKKGDLVAFEELIGVKDERSTFPHEAIGVRPVQ